MLGGVFLLMLFMQPTMNGGRGMLMTSLVRCAINWMMTNARTTLDRTVVMFVQTY